jgi:enoyl-CoA hydratase/carnithine racemase
MLKIFNFTTLNCYLDQTTRSLHIFITNGENNYFNTELLFEFETLIAWVNEHIEISALFIASSNENFSDGIDPELLSSLNRDQLENFLIRLRKINLKLTQLAQTIVVDVGGGCANVASEFILCADIRIAHFNTKIKFDHHYLGLIPASGGNITFIRIN